jgi:NADH oxidase (H2O2-forming)
MEWQVILALVIAISIILIPVAFVLYLTVFGLRANTKEARERRAAARRLVREAMQIIRNKQAVDRSILEAIEAAEEGHVVSREPEVETALPTWITPMPGPTTEKAELVIVGGSAAGIQAAITAKRLNSNVGKITVIRKESKVLVPCGIPYIFGTLGSAEKNLIPDSAIGDAELVIDEVTSIDRLSQRVITAGGRSIGYDKLILATGSQPVVPPIPGRELDNVYTVKKDMEYLQGLDKSLAEAKDVVVIGGGFIGVEFADELRKRGLNVTIVELLPHCLSLNCDEPFCARVEEELAKANIKVLCGHSVNQILGNGKVSHVELSSGERLKADLVMMAIGSAPNTKLAQEAGLEIGTTKGIKVDQYMRTSDPNIFAVGDCAEKYSFFNAEPVPLRLASIATNEARIAASNLFRPCVENNGVIGVFSTRVGDVAVGTAGLTEKAAREAGFNVLIGKASAPDRHPGGMPGAQPMHVNLIFDRSSGRILGGEAHGGVSVGELTNALAVLVRNKATAEDIRFTQIGTHPALTGSPIVYHMVNAAEQAMVAYHEAMAKERMADKTYV